MFDISCLYGQNEFQSIEQDAFNFWNALGCNNPLDPNVAQQVTQQWNIPEIGQHYFVDQGSPPTLTPVFDFSSTGGNNGDSNAIFFGAKNQDVPSPDGPNNVDWLQINQVPPDGLTTIVYRVYTVEGQPPASVSSSRSLDLSSCSINEILSVVPARKS